MSDDQARPHGHAEAGPAEAGPAEAGPAEAGPGQLYPPQRVARVAEATAAAGLSALLLTPGPDLRYVTGYEAHQLERLTCLAIPAADAGWAGRAAGSGAGAAAGSWAGGAAGSGAGGAAGSGAGAAAFLVVPRLELPAALASPAAGLGLEIIGWDETDDPYALVARGLGAAGTGPVGISDRMWALMALAFRDALPAARQELASRALRPLRARKSPAEVQALREAGQAIDRVHARVPGWLRPGRTEREVAAEVAAAIVAEGHARVDFAIVASGPNAASPHHEAAGRVLTPGDAVVVDIGGTMPSGYCSDCTRTYAIGQPPAEFTAYYRVLQAAQAAACEAVRPGVTAQAIDAAAREPIEAAGYGRYFVHRTGHGIGLESHEDPYIVMGNHLELVAGMAFSIEPGIYPGPHGARIEDIVVCGEDGAIRLNTVTRDLVTVDA